MQEFSQHIANFKETIIPLPSHLCPESGFTTGIIEGEGRNCGSQKHEQVMSMQCVLWFTYCTVNSKMHGGKILSMGETGVIAVGLGSDQMQSLTWRKFTLCMSTAQIFNKYLTCN